MNPAGIAFISFVFLLFLGVLLGSWMSKEERRLAKEAKEQSDKEYQEQQSLHQGDC